MYFKLNITTRRPPVFNAFPVTNWFWLVWAILLLLFEAQGDVRVVKAQIGVGMVQEVVSLHPELDLLMLLEVEVLVQGQVAVDVARSLDVRQIRVPF